MTAPAPVPALPDTERRTAYSISSQTGPFAVNFAIYGDSTDYIDWVEVWLNNVILASNAYSLSSPSGSIATLPRPITDAVINLVVASTGNLQIVGARRPRRTTQFAENRGVPARDFNQAFSDVIAQLREMWDRTRSRMFSVPAGENVTQIPQVSIRANTVFGFDGAGNPIMLPLKPPVTDPAVIQMTINRSQIPTTTLGSATIAVSGHVASGDRGAGAIYTSNGAIPGGPMAIQDLAGTWFNLVMPDRKLNVLWFGAKGDGTTDDTAAVNLALALVAVTPYSTLYFPAGRYVISNAITSLNNISNYTIAGDGMFASLLLNHCTGGTTMFGTTTNTSSSIQQTNVTVRDIGIIGQWAIEHSNPMNNCLAFGSTSRLRISNIYISNSDGYGIVGRNCHDVIISGCIMSEIAVTGVSMFGSNITVSGNSIEHTGDDVIDCHVDTGNTEEIQGGVTISNNRCSDCFGIKCIGGRKIEITGNKVERTFAHGIAVDVDTGAGYYVGSYSVNISDNNITDCFNPNSAFGGPYPSSNDYIRVQAIDQAGGGAVIPGLNNPAAGTFVALYPSLRNSGAGAALPGSWWVNISNNVCTRTIPIGTLYSSLGAGQKFLNNGYVDFTTSSANAGAGNGIALWHTTRKAAILGNIINGVGVCVNFNLFSAAARLEDIIIANNLFSDITSFGIWFTNAAIATGTTRGIRIFNNIFDGDPFCLSTNRTATGGWTADGLSLNKGPIGIYSGGQLDLYTAEHNIFRNVVNITDAFGAYRDNILECNPTALGFNTNNKGIGNLPAAGAGFTYRVINCDPNSANYGNVINTCLLENASQPAAGTYVQGHLTYNSSPAIAAGKTTLGWRRLTTGTAHVANTDWIALVVPNA